MRLSRTLLLALGLAAGATAAAFAQEVKGLGGRLPEQTLKVSHRIEIGDLSNPLELDLTVSPALQIREQRTFLDVSLSEPKLYANLLDAFTSHAKSGCSMVYRQGEGLRAFEAQLCTIKSLSITFDPQQSAGRLRARARVRARVDGVQGPASDHRVSLQTRIGFRDGSLVLRPVKLDIEGLPSDASRRLLEEFDEVSFFLHRCLSGADLAVEDLSLEEGSNELRIEAASELSESFRILSCIGSERFRERESRERRVGHSRHPRRWFTVPTSRSGADACPPAGDAGLR